MAGPSRPRISSPSTRPKMSEHVGQTQPTCCRIRQTATPCSALTKKTFHTCFRLLADVFRLTRNPWPLNSKMLDFIYPRLAATAFCRRSSLVRIAAPPSSHAAQVYSRRQQQTHAYNKTSDAFVSWTSQVQRCDTSSSLGIITTVAPQDRQQQTPANSKTTTPKGLCI